MTYEWKVYGRVELKDEEDGRNVAVFAKDDHLLLMTKDGKNDQVLDDRTVLDTITRQDADDVAIPGVASLASPILRSQMAAQVQARHSVPCPTLGLFRQHGR
jgi:hypothetical protein